ncbi:MAG: hypothetical protein PHV74_13795 [Dehalococcoidia bacterium]|nr:hypothetical protein [Dehalococcoidia bacterium]
MDIYCTRCGEPWDAYGAQQALDMTRQEYNRMMEGEGCPCCFGKPIEDQPFRARLAAELHAVLGDDIDGLAVEMEDAEFFMGSEFWE